MHPTAPVQSSAPATPAAGAEGADPQGTAGPVPSRSPFEQALLAHVAERLYQQLGARAVALSTGAIGRLHRACDGEGTALWMDLHSRITALAQADGGEAPRLH